MKNMMSCFREGDDMEELIKRLERVIATGAPDKDGMHPISAEVVLEVVKAQLGANLSEVGTDCISRQAAIDYFVTNVGFHDEDGYPIEDTDELRKIWTEYFSGIPSAEPKRGWWIEIINSRGVVVALRCSRCEKSPRHGVRSDFCPNCGAKMEGTT